MQLCYNKLLISVKQNESLLHGVALPLPPPANSMEWLGSGSVAVLKCLHRLALSGRLARRQGEMWRDEMAPWRSTHLLWLTADTREDPRQSSLKAAQLLKAASRLCLISPPTNVLHHLEWTRGPTFLVSRSHEPLVTLLGARPHSGPCSSLFRRAQMQGM